MATVLDALVAAFSEHHRRIAVFDRRTREQAGVWRTDQSIPVDAIIETFAERAELSLNGMTVVPIHDTNSAELTGEFVLYHRSRPAIIYYDYSESEIVSLPLSDVARSYPGWRIRFWHPDFIPPETPSFIVDHFQSATGPEAPPVPVHETAQTPDGEEFFENLRIFVQRERDATRQDAVKRYHQSRGSQFLRSNFGISRASSAGRRVDSEGNQTCVLTVDENNQANNRSAPWEFIDGVEVLVDTIGDLPGFPVEGVVESATDTELELWIRWTSSDDHSAAETAFGADSDAKFRVVEIVNPIPFDRQHSAIDAVAGSDRKREILLGSAGITTGEPSRIDPSTRHRLNQYQLGALRSALEVDSVWCIHGPPGTGKTRTLVHLIREAVYAGEKVLACAHSNQAIDNLLVGASTANRTDPDSLHAAVVDGQIEMARAGTNSRNELVNDRYVRDEFWGVNVVGATTSAAHRFQEDEFDLVVVDEATQATIPSALIPFSKGKRIVLAGDHQQLPPYVSSEFDDEERMEISLFEHFLGTYGDEVATMLQRQYRMHEAIAAFPNEQFYENKLHHGQRNRKWTIGDLEPLIGIHVSGVEQRTPAGSYYNELEVERVGSEVSRLLKRGVVPSDIGVISPYSGQVGKITASLPDDVLERGLTVATVDSFQGSQREAIIVSFVRANESGNIGFLGFPEEGPRRLNVALTRAKKRCVLIGNWETLAGSPGDRPTSRSGSDLFRALRAHLKANDILVQTD